MSHAVRTDGDQGVAGALSELFYSHAIVPVARHRVWDDIHAAPDLRGVSADEGQPVARVKNVLSADEQHGRHAARTQHGQGVTEIVGEAVVEGEQHSGSLTGQILLRGQECEPPPQPVKQEGQFTRSQMRLGQPVDIRQSVGGDPVQQQGEPSSTCVDSRGGRGDPCCPSRLPIALRAEP